jgi:Domain of unknown function (DUF4338)
VGCISVHVSGADQGITTQIPICAGGRLCNSAGIEILRNLGASALRYRDRGDLLAIRSSRIRHRAVRVHDSERALIDTTPVIAHVNELRPVEVQQVRRAGDESLFNSLIEHHHYLGYEQPVGEHLKYLVWSHGRPVACMAWSSAPRHLSSRDRFIGWSQQARKHNVRFIAYNTRFLILPWIQAPHLASHILSRVTATLSRDWERMYGHPIWFTETFVDPERFRGTYYRAANWILLGRTTGRGKDDLTHRQNRSIKEVFGLPLTRRFRELLSQ